MEYWRSSPTSTAAATQLFTRYLLLTDVMPAFAITINVIEGRSPQF
jgi:hypothetical protein